MKSLPVIQEELPCTNCIATKQMRESQYCTKTIVLYEGQYIPGCMIKLMGLEQAERNHLTCQTYSLGIYSVCKTCPLECEKNETIKTKSPIQDILSLLGGMFGLDNTKQKEIDSAFNRLNKPEFKDVYSSLERASKVLKDVMAGNAGSSDIAKKVLELESLNLKTAFDNLIKDGKISEEEARIIKTEVNSSANMQKLKSMVEIMKKQNGSKN